MLPEIGITGLIVILIVALLVFGPKRLPEIGRSLGSGMREFKQSVTGESNSQHTALPPAQQPPAQPPAAAAPVAQPAAPPAAAPPAPAPAAPPVEHQQQ